MARSCTTGHASRAEGDLREQQGRFSRDAWDGARAALPTYLYDETTPRLLATRKTSAYIKIAEGCDHPCCFCIIPKLRGKFRSRRFESVVAEAEQPVAQGVREITLIGQDTTCYGEDLGLKDGLAALLRSPGADLPGLTLAALPLRLSEQDHRRACSRPSRSTTTSRSISTCRCSMPRASVLKRMKRGANAEIFLQDSREGARRRARASRCAPASSSASPARPKRTSRSSDGFRPRGEVRLAGRLRLLRRRRRAAVRSGQGAQGPEAHHRGAPPHADEAAADDQPRSASSSGSAARWTSWSKARAKRRQLLWEGRTQFHAPEIDGKVYINDFGPHETLVPGTFYRAEITEAHDYDVVARILE